MNYMVRRTRSAIFGRCTIFLTTQIRLDSFTGTQVLISTWYPDTQVGVDTDLNELKNGTSAKNGGPCTPYPIIHEPELRLPSY